MTSLDTEMGDMTSLDTETFGQCLVYQLSVHTLRKYISETEPAIEAQ